MAQKVGEMFISILVDTAKGDLSVKGLVGRMGELNVASLTGIGSMTAMAGALEDMVSGSIDTAHHLRILRDTFSLNTMEVQRWQAVGSAAGLSADQMAASLGNLASQINHLKKFGEGPMMGVMPILERYGMKDPRTMQAPQFLSELMRIAPLMDKMQPGMLLTIMEQLGHSELLPTIRLTAREVSDVLEHAPAMNLEQQHAAEMQRAQLNLLREDWKKMALDISASVLPSITRVTKEIISTVGGMKDLAKESVAYRSVIEITGVAIATAFNPILGVLAAIGVAKAENAGGFWDKALDNFVADDPAAAAARARAARDYNAEFGEDTYDMVRNWMRGRGGHGKASTGTSLSQGPVVKENTVVQHFHGPADPDKVGKAAEQGIKRADSGSLNSSGAQSVIGASTPVR